MPESYVYNMHVELQRIGIGCYFYALEVECYYMPQVLFLDAGL